MNSLFFVEDLSFVFNNSISWIKHETLSISPSSVVIIMIRKRKRSHCCVLPFLRILSSTFVIEWITLKNCEFLRRGEIKYKENNKKHWNRFKIWWIFLNSKMRSMKIFYEIENVNASSWKAIELNWYLSISLAVVGWWVSRSAHNTKYLRNKLFFFVSKSTINRIWKRNSNEWVISNIKNHGKETQLERWR